MSNGIIFTSYTAESACRLVKIADFYPQSEALKIMTSDYAMVTTVKRQFARRLPSALVSLVLEFANFKNAERKRAFLVEFKRFTKVVSGPFGNSSIRFYTRTVLPCIDSDVYRSRQINSELERDKRPDLDLRMEVDYTSCLHPSLLYLDGRSYIIKNWADSWQTMKFEHNQKMNLIRKQIPGPLHRRSEHCSRLCHTTSGPRRRRGVR